MYSLRVASLLLFACVLSACGGGGGGSSDGGGASADATPVNLTIHSLSVLSDTPEISYPLRLSVDVSSDEPVAEATVSLFIMEQSDDPEADVRQIPLGTDVVDMQNRRAHEFEFVIPATVEIPGDYYLVAVLDPTDELVETDEEDNTASIAINLAPALIPNLFITDLELDRQSLEINTGSYDDLVDLVEDNVYNADAASTVTVEAEGLREDSVMPVEAFARLRLQRRDVGTSHDVPLYLWNTAASRYINAYGVDPAGGGAFVEEEWLPLGSLDPRRVQSQDGEVVLEDVVRESSYLNFYFPGKLGSVLAYEMRYGHLDSLFSNASAPALPPPDLTGQAIRELEAFLRDLPSNGIAGDESDAMAVMDFAICVAVRPVDAAIIESDGTDNQTCSPLLITLPPVAETILPPVDLDGYNPMFSRPAGPIGNDIGYKTKGGGSVFGFELELGSYATADDRGYREGILGDVPLKIFGFDYSFMKLDLNAQIVPEYPGKSASERSRFSIEFKHAGQLLTRIVKAPSNTQVSFGLDELSVSKELPDPKKGGIAESTIFVGPIPLSAGAYVAGNFGMDIKPFVFRSRAPNDYALGVQGGPYANIEAVMYAGVGSRRLPVLVGVEGVLNLLDARFVLFNGVDINVREKLSGFPDTVEFVVRQGPKGTVVFTGPQGKLNLFAQYTVPKIKKCKVGLIKIPCPGFAKIKAVHNIWRSPALFRFEDVLFEANSIELDVVIREGKDTLYFEP